MWKSVSMRSVLLGLLVILPLILNVQAHTYLSSFDIGGVDLAEFDCVRPHPPSGREDPIFDVTGTNMTCGFVPYALEPANRKCPIAAGSTIGLQWHHIDDEPTDDIIDASHLGPCLVYMAKSDSGSGPVWFKIYEDGYDPTTGKWCVDTLRANLGLLTVAIPNDIAPGNYLIRGEIIALHQAYELDGAQFYIGCGELTVSGSGTANPSGVALPGAYTDTDPGILINIYTGFTTYTIPGPAVYVPSGGSDTPTTTPTTAPTEEPTSAPTTAPTSAPTDAPTAAPTEAPTSAPTTAPTSAPTDAPTTAPTEAPTSAPTTPTSAPSSGITVQLHAASNVYWIAVEVSPSTVSNVEIEDSGAITSWTAMQPTSWGYWTYSAVQAEIVMPVSLRITSSTNEQVIIDDAITSWGTATSGNSGTVSLQTHVGSSAWWFAVAVEGNSANIAIVQIKDFGLVSSFTNMSPTSYGYWTFSPQGSPLVSPLTIRVISSNGNTIQTILPSITPGAATDTGAQL